MSYFNRVKKYTSLFEPEINFLMNMVTSAPEGDVIVAGTYNGGDVMSMILTDPNREYHVIDSFMGLTNPVKEDIVAPNDNPEITTMVAGEFSCGGIDHYLDNFKEAKIVPPSIYPMYINSKKIKEVKPNKIAVMWLDLDHYAPTKVCLEYFDQFLVPGAILGCHDYGFVRCPGIKPACDEYSKKWKHGAGGIFFMRK